MFTPEEGELVLWRGSPTYSSRLLAFGFLGASLVGVGSFFGLSTLYFLLGDQRVMTSMVKKDGKYYFVRNYLSFSLLKDPKEPAKIARTAAEEYYRTIRSVNPVKQENSKEP